jgi:hypothetical protein
MLIAGMKEKSFVSAAIDWSVLVGGSRQPVDARVKRPEEIVKDLRPAPVQN